MSNYNVTTYQAIVNFYVHWDNNCSVDENLFIDKMHSMVFCQNDSQCNGKRVCTQYGDCYGYSGCDAWDWRFVSNGIYVNGIASNAQLDQISLL